jgi:hypothetical protein
LVVEMLASSTTANAASSRNVLSRSDVRNSRIPNKAAPEQ